MASMKAIRQYVKDNLEDFVDARTNEINLTELEGAVADDLDIDEEDGDDMDLSNLLYNLVRYDGRIKATANDLIFVGGA